jgi:putative ABC transport system ATP-binding protein
MDEKKQKLDQADCLLKAKNISHSFDYELFNSINLKLKNHESIAIIGVSGCGKSTFLNILSSLLIPNSGEVIYKNKNIYKCKEDELAKIRRDDFGIIFQSHYLLRGFNAKENLEISSLLSGNPIDKNLIKILNIDFVIDQNIGELSGGQQQRLSIARVLTKKPSIIFADEPTGNLDKKTAFNVMNTLFDYIRENDSALVIVTHEEQIAYKCDHVYEFNENKLKKIK